MVHPEVVLEGDGRECLGSGLDLDVFLGLDCLMETVAPAASLHDTSCLLVHDLDLSVLDDVVNLLVEHGVRLEKLAHGMNTLRLKRKVCQDVVLLHLLLLRAEGGVLLDFCDSGSNVRKDEEIRV